MTPKPFLRCLGQPAFLGSNGEPIRIRTKKHLAVLVYLAVEPRRSHRRDDLAELLWPKAKLTEARHSLSTALSLFRARLGPDTLVASRDEIALRPGRLTLDLERLLSGDVLGNEFTPPLEVAAFLDGFDIADAPEFALWKDRQHARLLPAIKQALLVLMDRCRRTGDFPQIEMLADRMLSLDDLSEEAIRAKMEARALSGDRITALRVFEDWKVKLEDDLQAIPSAALQQTATRLRRPEWRPTTAIQSVSTPTERMCDRPFVGRAAEYQLLYEAWERARSNVSGHVLVLGDSGIGKTTLVQRFRAMTALGGAAVARVQCYDIERDIPYSAINALVIQLLDQQGALATSPDALAELSRTVPEIRRRFPSLPIAAESHRETARIKLTEAFLELLLTLTDEQPVLLIVDDIHFADDASLAVLHLALRRSRGYPVMMLFITRPGELSHSPQAEQLRENASSLGISEVILEPLSIRESQSLLALLIPYDQTAPSASAQRLLLHAAAGYPMVLELLLQDWQTSGDQSLAIAVNAMTEELSNTNYAAAAYCQILQQITRSLRPAAQAALRLAAILGHRLNELDVYSLVGLSQTETTNGLADLVSRRLLRDNGQKLEFTNELIRGAVYLAIPSPSRRRLHSQVADWFLYCQDHTTDDELGLEIAWHCVRAGRIGEIADPLLRGSRSALRRGAPFSAEHALSTALPALLGQQRTEAILLLAEAFQEQCRWNDSIQALSQLDQPLADDVADFAYVFLVRAQRMTGHSALDDFPGILLQLTQFIRRSRNPSRQVRAALEAASIVNTLRLSKNAPEILSSIEGIPEESLDVDDRAQILLARAMLRYALKDLDASIREVEAGIELLRTRNAINSTMAMLYCGVGAIHALKGQYEEALAAHLQGVEIAHRVGSERIHALAAANTALAHTRLGHYNAAVQWSEQALAYRSETQPSAAQAHLLANAMLGRSDAVEESIDRHTPHFRKFHPEGIRQAWDLYCADAYLMLNKRQEAEDIARRTTSIDHRNLLLDSCAGPYARWIAKLHPNDEATLQQLRQLTERLTEFDALDQLEILIAIIQVERRLKIIHGERITEASLRIKKFPIGVIDQLQRLEAPDCLSQIILDDTTTHS
jgi:DNA-binding SARP family transcriptional activator